MVLTITHSPTESVARLGGWLSGAGVLLDVRSPYDGSPLPSLRGFDGLLVMGGAMGAYDDDVAPWLPATRDLLREAVAEQIPTLGVCLGGQLLAAALGGSVAKAPRKEIGWFDVAPLPAAREDPLFAAAPAAFTAFHWHGDAFTLPPGAVPLAASAMTPLQAFRIGARAWGIQFHLETDAQVLDAMLDSGAEELREAAVDTAAIRAKASAELRRLRELALRIFGRWADLL